MAVDTKRPRNMPAKTWRGGEQPTADATLLTAQLMVVDAACDWVHDIDRTEGELLTALRQAVADLERLEKDNGNPRQTRGMAGPTTEPQDR